jgi:hypothetical protein
VQHRAGGTAVAADEGAFETVRSALEALPPTLSDLFSFEHVQPQQWQPVVHSQPQQQHQQQFRGKVLQAVRQEQQASLSEEPPIRKRRRPSASPATATLPHAAAVRDAQSDSHHARLCGCSWSHPCCCGSHTHSRSALLTNYWQPCGLTRSQSSAELHRAPAGASSREQQPSVGVMTRKRSCSSSALAAMYAAAQHAPSNLRGAGGSAQRTSDAEGFSKDRSMSSTGSSGSTSDCGSSSGSRNRSARATAAAAADAAAAAAARSAATVAPPFVPTASVMPTFQQQQQQQQRQQQEHQQQRQQKPLQQQQRHAAAVAGAGAGATSKSLHSSVELDHALWQLIEKGCACTHTHCIYRDQKSHLATCVHSHAKCHHLHR